MKKITYTFMILSLAWLTNCIHPLGDDSRKSGSSELTRDDLVGKWIRKGPGPATSLYFKEDGTVEGDLMMDGQPEVIANYAINGNYIEISDKEGQTCPGKGIYEATPGRYYIGFELVDDSCYGRIRAIMGYYTKPGYEDILIDLDLEIESSDAPELLLERARVLMALGRPQEARVDLDAYLAIDSTDARVYMNRAGTRFPDDLHGVINDCNKALEMNPNDKNSFHMRGIARYQLGKKAEACEDFSRAIELGYTFLNKSEAGRCAAFWEDETGKN